MHLVDKEEEEEEEEDSSEAYRAMDEDSESSEGTGSTSAETNAETIWPAESIEVLSMELKNTIINKQCPGEKIVKEDGSTKTEELGDSIVASPLEVKNTSVNLQSLESKEKIVEEEDQSNKTEEFGDFNNSKSNILNNDTDNHENSKDPMSLKKKEMLELVEVNNQTAARRKIWANANSLLKYTSTLGPRPK
ncbi:unnamed protein product [Dovyalis caffra]|uniref:Uncharacterized protein n=1 Tax=Dovyalis caffra TaxID=77055 RepID=A0AAV1SBW2_9ROSI|nr:unnamed protein product [Dovyalis caffra]